MTLDKYQPPAEYLTLRQAQERLGVSKTKAWQLVRDGSLPVHADPRDRRVKLVRVEDVERLLQPQPMASRGR